MSNLEQVSKEGPKGRTSMEHSEPCFTAQSVKRRPVGLEVRGQVRNIESTSSETARRCQGRRRRSKRTAAGAVNPVTVS